MTQLEQVNALRELGYSPSEARFLIPTILHSSYFLRRHISENGGSAAHRLCLKVIQYGHAKRVRCQSRTELYHLHNRSLYEVLNHPAAGCYPKKALTVRPRLMSLDYVLAHGDERFLASETSKLSYFVEERGLPVSILPSRALSTSKDRLYFPEHYPIRIDSETNGVGLIFVDDGGGIGPNFLAWMNNYRDLIANIENVEIVYVSTFNGRFERATQQFRRTFPESESPLSKNLTGYFQQRLEIESKGVLGKTQAQLNEYRTLSKQYAEPRFEQHYEPWKAGTIQAHREHPVRFSTYHLPYDYRFLGPRLNVAN